MMRLGTVCTYTPMEEHIEERNIHSPKMRPRDTDGQEQESS